MAKKYEYEVKWSKHAKTGRDILMVYRMKNGKCVKRLYVKEIELLLAAGTINDQAVTDWLKTEKEYKLRKESEKAEKLGAPKVKANDEEGFAPRSPELYNYLAGLYKVKTWGNI